jgi:selenocysteine-specific elongation factor
VLDPLPPRRTAIRTGSAAERCRRLDFDPIDMAPVEAELRASQVMIEDAGASGLRVDALVSRVGVEPRDLPSRVEALAKRGVAVQVGDVLVTRPLLERVRRAILDGLTAHHLSQPLSEGLSRGEARVRLFGRGHPAVFDRVLEELIVGRFVVGRDRLALASHHVEWSPDAARAREIIEQTFRDAGLAPPDPASLPSVSGAPPGVVDQVVRLLLRQKVLVKVDTLVFHDETLRRLKQEVGAMKGSVGPDARIDVRTFKERFGVTRKFAIPLLEYLDRERVTRRVGDARLIL